MKKALSIHRIHILSIMKYYIGYITEGRKTYLAYHENGNHKQEACNALANLSIK